jgi:Fe-S cluster biogenesis protein NfuA
MFIQTESTPNPNSLKFILGDYELCENPIEFNKSQKDTRSALADELFKINGIENILFNKNCISVNKNEYTWDQLKASILHVISNHIISGLPAIEIEDSNCDELDKIHFDYDDIKIVKMINSILSSKIRPAIMQDGGDVKFIKYNSGIAYLSLKGSCAGCPSATVTLKNGIENMLKHHVPEVKKVEQVL